METKTQPAYPEELYSHSGTADKLEGLDAIDADAIARYRDQGYLAVEGVFGADSMEEAKAAVADLLLLRVGGYSDIHFEVSVQGNSDRMTEAEKLDSVRKIRRFTPHEPRLHTLAHTPNLIQTLTQLLGENPYLFQDMALLKPPRIGIEKPWHQDMAYFNYPPDSRIVGVWIALDESLIENGCMHVMQGAHRQGPILHFQRRDWQICDTEMIGRQSVAVPLKPGGVLFFDALLPHGTPNNSSPLRRRALQFHYVGVSVKPISEEVRFQIFGSEGKGAEC